MSDPANVELVMSMARKSIIQDGHTGLELYSGRGFSLISVLLLNCRPQMYGYLPEIATIISAGAAPDRDASTRLLSKITLTTYHALYCDASTFVGTLEAQNLLGTVISLCFSDEGGYQRARVKVGGGGGRESDGGGDILRFR